MRKLLQQLKLRYDLWQWKRKKMQERRGYYKW